MVTHWGMSERLGPVAFRTSEEHPFLGREIIEQREFSEHTAQIIDEEIGRILRTASDQALEMLSQHRDKLDSVAKALEEKEVLDEEEFEQLIGPPPHRKLSMNGQSTDGKPHSAGTPAIAEGSPPL